jgi:hypothetical protein
MNMRKSRWVCLIMAAVFAAPIVATSTAGEPSDEYKAGLRKTLERRKQRRLAGPGQADGLIVPYPMPPALIIRQTRESHDEIQSLLDMLRYNGR